MKELSGKKILFVAPKYFGYEIEIKNKLEILGAEVDYYDERPSNSSYVKASIRLWRTLVRNKIVSYYEEIIKANKEKEYDYIFFIHLETPFPDLLKRLKKVNPKGIYILYMWDSMLHRPNTVGLTKHFDEVYTFDRIDAKKFDFKFLPLFFLTDFNSHETSSNLFDITFLGTVHSDRYFILKELKKQANNINLKSKWFLFSHNKLLFYKLKFSSFKNIDASINEFSFKPLNKKDVIELLKNSKVIIDIQHPENNGLTMRTMEVLALNKKLITTNSDVKNYDFYNPQNICIIDRNKPLISLDFFNSPYNPVKLEILNKYSLDYWITKIFQDNK